MSFEEYLDINYNEKLDDITKFLINDAFKAGEQSRQAEIDGLKKVIDEAIYDLQHIECAMWEEQVEHVLMVLKGEEND